jgi:hypothetical protein
MPAHKQYQNYNRLPDARARPYTDLSVKGAGRILPATMPGAEVFSNVWELRWRLSLRLFGPLLRGELSRPVLQRLPSLHYLSVLFNRNMRTPNLL